MKPFVWNEEMSVEETKDGAYWERNMLALLLAKVLNKYYLTALQGYLPDEYKSGWYKHGEWVGWSRIISLEGGKITFHIPDDFDIGDLPEIDPNWDGHTTSEKWNQIMFRCGVQPDAN